MVNSFDPFPYCCYILTVFLTVIGLYIFRTMDHLAHCTESFSAHLQSQRKNRQTLFHSTEAKKKWKKSEKKHTNTTNCGFNLNINSFACTVFRGFRKVFPSSNKKSHMAFSATNHKLVTPLPITTNATPKIFTLSTAYEYQTKMFPLVFVINVILCHFTSDFNENGRKKTTTEPKI